MNKNKIIIGIFGIIMAMNLVDVFNDVQLKVPSEHIMEEVIIILLSFSGALYLIFDMRTKTRHLKRLVQQISQKENEIENMTLQMKQARERYSQAVKEQFSLWALSKSEQEVAWLLLKGYSFKEIAMLRATHEKTVRQQASSIYTKSGVDGRHSFSAWFMEDFLQGVG
ncbi:MAG TPA: LuxR family transcriptional regulator [Aeromonadales bacterium]|nr:LuxR family transcriptional regulator [Aeromonadales bacterium]